MKLKPSNRFACCAAALLLALSPASEVIAHGGGNWDPFTIDTVNDKARDRLLELQALVSEVIRGRIGNDEWPLGELRESRDQLLTLKEDVDEIVAHFVFDGVNIQAASQLRTEPRAGRAEAANRGIAAGIALIEHAMSFENAEAVVGDFYAFGMTARLYELLGAHIDRMELYAVLTSQIDKLRAADSLPE
ncbi:MAG: hypothetical protein OEO82_02675 [Gammaproteobacteria bacterium]|nr:hypothetical protein [Gammaproteobacteria bacterium]